MEVKIGAPDTRRLEFWEKSQTVIPHWEIPLMSRYSLSEHSVSFSAGCAVLYQTPGVKSGIEELLHTNNTDVEPRVVS